MTWEFSVALVPFALLISSLGALWKVWGFLAGRRGHLALSEREIGIEDASFFNSILRTAVSPVMTFGMKANPVRTVSWFLFHLGMAVLVVHGLVAGAVLVKWYGLGPEIALRGVLMTGVAKRPVFDIIEMASSGSATIGLLGLMYSRIWGRAGGMLFGVDGPTQALRTRTGGLRAMNDILIPVLVLSGIVSGMAVSYLSGTFLGLHLLIVLILVALFPFTRLFHAAFYYWIGLYYGAKRNIQRITA